MKKVLFILLILSIVFCVCVPMYFQQRISNLQMLCDAHIAVEKENAKTERCLRETIARFEEADEARVQELRDMADELRQQQGKMSQEEVADFIESVAFRYHGNITEDTENTCIE